MSNVEQALLNIMTAATQAAGLDWDWRQIAPDCRRECGHADDHVMLFVMTTEEAEILELLKRFPNRYLSVTDISKTVGPRRNFNEDRNWALPVLRRMEMEGWVESGPFGEYRAKTQSEDTTLFKKALETPGMALGDTTIVCLGDLKDDRAEAV